MAERDTEEDELEAGRMPLIEHLIELRNRLMAIDLTKMWGFSMNLQTGANSFLLDDVQVYQQVLDVETFEGAKTIQERGISVFNGNNAPPTLTIEANPRDDAPDNHALKVDYDIPSGQYGGFVQDLSDPQDWSQFAGIRFWYFGRQRSSAAPGRV